MSECLASLLLFFSFLENFDQIQKQSKKQMLTFYYLFWRKLSKSEKGIFLFIIDISEVGFHDYDLLGAILAPYHYKEHCQVSSKSADGFLKY